MGGRSTQPTPSTLLAQRTLREASSSSRRSGGHLAPQPGRSSRDHRIYLAGCRRPDGHVAGLLASMASWSDRQHRPVRGVVNTSTLALVPTTRKYEPPGGSADGLASPFVALYIGDRGRCRGLEDRGRRRGGCEPVGPSGCAPCYWKTAATASSGSSHLPVQHATITTATGAMETRARSTTRCRQSGNRSRVRWLVIWESPGYSGHRLWVGPRPDRDLQNFGTWGMNQTWQNRALISPDIVKCARFAKCDLWADTSTDDP